MSRPLEEDERMALGVESVRLQIVMIANEMAIPDATIREMRISEYHDLILRRMVYQLKSYLLASGEETVECDEQWPADWREAIKERWAPKWVKRRWPVRYEEHHLHRTFYRAMCPHIEIPHHQGNEIHVQFLKERA